jgi:hypothetical protein
VISRLASRVFIAFVSAPVRFDRIVQEAAIVPVNRQWQGNFQRRQRPQRTRDNQVTRGCAHSPLRPLIRDKTEADGEQKVASQGVINFGLGWRLVRVGDQEVSEMTLPFHPEKTIQRFRGAIREAAPTFALTAGTQARELS